MAGVGYEPAEPVAQYGAGGGELVVGVGRVAQGLGQRVLSVGQLGRGPEPGGGARLGLAELLAGGGDAGRGGALLGLGGGDVEARRAQLRHE